MNIFLIGFRCSGKTSVGRTLSRRLGFAFVDTDREIVRHAGRSIAELVSERGWAFFRRLEKEILRRVSVSDRQVVATGGGAVLDIDNVRRMKAGGTVVWLTASAQTIRQRMAQDGLTPEQRPALTSDGTLDEIETTLRNRFEKYNTAMDFEIRTDPVTPAEICRRIVAELDRRGIIADPGQKNSDVP